MTRSTESRKQAEKREDKAIDADLPPSLESLWRMVKLAYAIEPRLLVASLLMTLAVALPQALVGLWLAVLVDGVNDGAATRVRVAALGLALSATLLWWLQGRLRPAQPPVPRRVSIAMEPTSPSCTPRSRPSPTRNDASTWTGSRCCAGTPSAWTTCSCRVLHPGWVLRLASSTVLLDPGAPGARAAGCFALPTVRRRDLAPGVERAVEARRPARAAGRHLFVLGTTAPPGKEVRVTGNGRACVRAARAEWRALVRPMRRARWATACGHAWPGRLRLGLRRRDRVRPRVIDAPPGDVLLVLVAGSQLSQYVGAPSASSASCAASGWTSRAG
jgi:ATP-binding cassette subfamily B protein